MALLFNLVTPYGVLYEGEVSYLEVPSSRGPLGILPAHTPLIAEIAPKGILSLTLVNGSKLFFVLFHGVLEVKKEKTIILSETAIEASTIEEAKSLLMSSSSLTPKLDEDVRQASLKIKKALK